MAQGTGIAIEDAALLAYTLTHTATATATAQGGEGEGVYTSTTHTNNNKNSSNITSSGISSNDVCDIKRALEEYEKLRSVYIFYTLCLFIIRIVLVRCAL